MKHYDTTGSRTIEDADPNSSYAKAFALIPAGSRVLDLGCGPGELASYLAARGDRVWGVDINPAAVAQAAASCVATAVADLEEAEVAALFPGQRFDIVVVTDVLEHVREPWSLLQAAREVLDTGGRVVASIPNFAHAAVRLAVVSGAMPYRGLGILDDTHVRFFTVDGIRSLFEESGFRVQEIARTTLPFGQRSDLVPDVRVLNVPGEIERHVREDPEHETLQFVVRAVMLPGAWDMGALRGRLHDVEARAAEQAIGLRNLTREHAAASERADDAVARSRAAEARAHDLDAQLGAQRAALDELRAELAAATAARDAAERARTETARRLELDREAAAVELAQVRRNADAHLEEVRRDVGARLAEVRRDAGAQVAAADAALRETREQLETLRGDYRRQCDGAQREAGELQAALNAAQTRGRALAEELAGVRAALDAATAEAAERAAAVQDAHEQLGRHDALAAEQRAAAAANRAALERALADAERALRDAVEESAQRAATARDTHELLVRNDAEGARVRELLLAATHELDAFRARARRDALVWLAGEHERLDPHDDGGQVWRNGFATR